jgi:hypothetical protein
MVSGIVIIVRVVAWALVCAGEKGEYGIGVGKADGGPGIAIKIKIQCRTGSTQRKIQIRVRVSIDGEVGEAKHIILILIVHTVAKTSI